MNCGIKPKTSANKRSIGLTYRGWKPLPLPSVFNAISNALLRSNLWERHLAAIFKRILKRNRNKRHRKYIMTETAKKLFIIAIILLILGEVSLFSAFSAAAPRDAYFDAEACYRSLRQNPHENKIPPQLDAVHQEISVGLQSGSCRALGGSRPLQSPPKCIRIWRNFPARNQTKKKLLTSFSRLSTSYPKSRYRQKAAREIRKLGASVSRPEDTAAEQHKLSPANGSNHPKMPISTPRPVTATCAKTPAK